MITGYTIAQSTGPLSAAMLNQPPFAGITLFRFDGCDLSPRLAGTPVKGKDIQILTNWTLKQLHGGFVHESFSCSVFRTGQN
jgi:hypothetical protein